MREFDIVLWGASGFTGQLVAEYLVRNYIRRDSGKTDLRLALAGRNEAKLRGVAEAVGAPQLPLLLGDSLDAKSLEAICARTKVVISTVGPYAKYGAELVGAAVRNRTHYCDLTGETPFIRAMIDAHHEAARKSGARIVHCCGYDSIPSDLGTLMVQEAMNTQHRHYASQVKLCVGKTKGGLSGGTLASLLNVVDEAKHDPSLRKILGNPYALNPAGIGGPDGSDQIGIRFDADLDQWTGPFLMAAINTRVVRRSHALMGLPWGKSFRYSEVMGTGPGPLGFARAAAMTGGIGAFMGLMALPVSRPLIEARLPSPGEGPSKAQRDNGYFETHLLAMGDEHLVRGLVADQQDPGYGSTARMLSESALCLALEEDELTSEGGILTPATAMGMRLVERLRAAGMTWEILSADRAR